MADKWIFWNIGSGNISFWHDYWCDFSLLSQWSSNKRSNVTIKQFWTTHDWDRPKLLAAIPSELGDYIMAFPTHGELRGIDREAFWKLTSHGCFSFKSAWEAVRQHNDKHVILKFCWNQIISPTMSFFMVRLLKKLVTYFGGPQIEGNDMRVKKIPFTAQRVCARIWGYLELIKGHKSIGPRVWAAAPGVADFLGLKLYPWFTPDTGVININTDRASKGNPGESAVGGIARDYQGNAIFAFHEFIGTHTNNYAELYAIWRALDLCRESGIFKIWTEVDSTSVLSLINSQTSGNWQVQTIRHKISSFRRSMDISFTHIYREGNAIADHLANEGYKEKKILYQPSDLTGRVG
ncbi:hypothetical protein OROMI_021020 [Orobanche minor]